MLNDSGDSTHPWRKSCATSISPEFPQLLFRMQKLLSTLKLINCYCFHLLQHFVVARAGSSLYLTSHSARIPKNCAHLPTIVSRSRSGFAIRHLPILDSQGFDTLERVPSCRIDALTSSHSSSYVRSTCWTLTQASNMPKRPSSTKLDCHNPTHHIVEG